MENGSEKKHRLWNLSQRNGETVSSQFSWEVIRQGKENAKAKSVKGSVVYMKLPLRKICIYNRASYKCFRNIYIYIYYMWVYVIFTSFILSEEGHNIHTKYYVWCKASTYMYWFTIVKTSTTHCHVLWWIR